MSARGIVIITIDEEDFELSLPMASLEKVEGALHVGIPKLLIRIQNNDLTITAAVTTIMIASQGKLKRKPIHDWCEKEGIQSLFTKVTELFNAVFADNDEEVDSSGKKP